MFVSTPLAIEALNALTIDGEEFTNDLVTSNPESYNPESPARSSPADQGALVVEIKKLHGRLDSLEKAIGKGGKGKGSLKGKKIKVWYPQK
ncbi:unnamed protein product [marine sediment metagenome]|uniref:Uncharacterized protein n=1 Tax=marine sediment metagenome TaxID=412755 RepID=X1Q1L1_9ZZZZ